MALSEPCSLPDRKSVSSGGNRTELGTRAFVFSPAWWPASLGQCHGSGSWEGIVPICQGLVGGQGAAGSLFLSEPFEKMTETLDVRIPRRERDTGLLSQALPAGGGSISIPGSPSLESTLPPASAGTLTSSIDALWPAGIFQRSFNEKANGCFLASARSLGSFGRLANETHPPMHLKHC